MFEAHGSFSGGEWVGELAATAGVETRQVVEMTIMQAAHARVCGRVISGGQLEHLAFNLLPASSNPRCVGTSTASRRTRSR